MTIEPGRPADAGSGRVTAVMITRDRGGAAAATVQQLRRLPERPPIIVVDNGSSDDTLAVLESIAGEDLTAVALAHNAGAAGRNIGVAQARTPYVAFVDDDSGWEPGALTRAADLLDDHPRLAVLAGAVLVGAGRALDPTCRRMAESPLRREADLPGPAVLGFIACGAVVRRAPFLEVGGFDERLGVGGEEMPLTIDLVGAGWGVCYADSVIALHWPSATRAPQERRRRVVRNELWLLWRRRRLRSVAANTTRAALAAVRDPAARGGLFDALGDVGRVVRERRPVDRQMESALRLLER